MGLDIIRQPVHPFPSSKPPPQEPDSYMFPRHPGRQFSRQVVVPDSDFQAWSVSVGDG
jgi:hypothetical protein